MQMYGWAVKAIMDGFFTGKTLKAMLLTGDYVPDINHSTVADVDDDEVSGSGYSAGGITVGGFYSAYDSTNHVTRLMLGSPNLNFGSIVVPDIGFIVLYVSYGDPAADQLLTVEQVDSSADGSSDWTWTPGSDGLVVGKGIGW